MERLIQFFRNPQTQEIPTKTSPIIIQESQPTQILIERKEPEISEEEAKQWESAFLGKEDLWHRQSYLTSLALREDPTKRVYGILNTDNVLGVQIDIPLEDPTPQADLVKKAYLQATFFGEIDQEKYRDFATNMFNRDKLLAFLNREAAGVPPEEVLTWFYETFAVTHLHNHGSVFIGSHGAAVSYGYNENVTISPEGRRNHPDKDPLRTASEFTKTVNESLPNLEVLPLAVDTYLQDIRTTLRFLPQDWKTS